MAQEEGKDVQLNRMKTRLASKYGLETSPRLVDIIAAVPHEYRNTIVPKLKAKPVRTASGVSHMCVITPRVFLIMRQWFLIYSKHYKIEYITTISIYKRLIFEFTKFRLP